MKRYRWNKKKCMKNIASLATRTAIATVILLILGSGPTIAIDENAAGKGVQTMMMKELPPVQYRSVYHLQELEEILVDEHDLEILAHVVAGEAMSCDDKEQQYVASVVLNRVGHHLFPDTVQEVVEQPGQYGCIKNGVWKGVAAKPDQRCYDNARYILQNGPILPSNVVFQAQFAQGDGLYEETRWHKYCYTNK